jgi:hypothetical protein
VREALLGSIVAAVDAVHDLQRAVGLELAAASLDPAHERRRLVGEAEPDEAVERERTVAEFHGVAMSQVALAGRPSSGSLEGGRGRRSDPWRGRGQQLEDRAERFTVSRPSGRV